MQRLLANDIDSGKNGLTILMMPILIKSNETLSDGILKKLQHLISKQLKSPASVEILRGTQSGIWGLFSDIVTVSWAYPHDDEVEATKVKQDADQLGLQLKTLLQEIGLPTNITLRYTQHSGTLNADKPMDSQWRGLFAQAIIKLDILERGES